METEENRYSIQLAPRALPAATNPAVIYLASLRATGRRTQASALSRLAAFLGLADPAAVPWERLAYGHAKRLATWLRDEAGMKPATARRYWAALRGVLREADALGLMPPGEWSRIRDLRARFGRSADAGRALAPEEVATLLTVDPRVAAIVALGALAGLRREEIVGLNWSDLGVGEDGQPAVRAHGKGGKERVVPLGSRAQAALRTWAAVAPRGVDLTGGGPMFPGRGNGGLRHLGLTGVTYVLAAAAKAAGIPPFTPHDLRRTYITRLLEKGNDLAVVSKLAGHEQIETTKRYDKRGAAARRVAAETLD